MAMLTMALFSVLNSCSQQSARIDKEVNKMLASMTLEEKVSMLHANSKFTSTGVERLGISEINYTDGPHGIREELERHSWSPAGLTTDSATYFPTGSALAATWNPELAYKMGVGLGKEARARNKDILLGPAINIQRTPVCGRTYEYLSEDPLLNAKMAVGYVKGAQSCDVAVSVKHFAANNQEKDRGTVDVNMSDRTLNEMYLPAFKAAVTEGGALTVMGAYNRFRGEYCCENDFLLNQVLRKQWGFEGFVVSDWSAVHDTRKAALGGLDIEMGTGREYNDYFMAGPLLELVKKGEIDEKLIDEKVANILRVLYKIKKFGPETRVKGELNSKESQQTAYQIASESITLLKNEEGILPLKKDKIKKIAIIGDNATRLLANGGFGAGVKAQYEITPLEGLKNRLGNEVELIHVQGYEKRSKVRYKNEIERDRMAADEPDYTLIAEAAKVAGQCDLAIIIGGLNLDYDTEASDRVSLKMPYGQDSLIAAVARANHNTVMVVVAGSPVDLEVSLAKTKAVLYAWLNGSEGGNALADVLLGKVNPSGKLPFTLPAKLEDVSVHALGTYPGVEGKVNYDEGLLVGYRWFDTKNIEPQVPFGFGLSYTRFEYANLKVNKSEFAKDDNIVLNFDLKNSGEMAGAEVVQLYANDVESSVERPEKELRAFTKVWLQPGEVKQVTLEIPVSSLAFYDETLGGWNVEAGSFDLRVASSSRKIELNQVVAVK